MSGLELVELWLREGQARESACLAFENRILRKLVNGTVAPVVVVNRGGRPAQPGSVSSRVLACFNGTALGVNQVCAALPDVQRQTINVTLGALKQRGRLERVGFGVYQRRKI